MMRIFAAEAIGTALLLAVVVGSGIMGESLATGNTAVALLANSIATGAALVVLIWIFGPVSGAHFNPAVSLVFWRRQAFDAQSLAMRIGAQIVGAIAGVLLAHAMFDMAVFQTGDKIRTGPGQWLSEGVATFGLILTILACVRRNPQAVAVAVGLYIASAYWFTASTSFANPAVTLARSLTTTFAGIRPVDVAPFIAAQLAGAWLAFRFELWLGGSEGRATSQN